MLIESHRHTPQDLAYWSQLEEADLQHGLSMLRGDKQAKAVAAMQQFREPHYVATSWGKDSVVVAHLLACSGLSLPLVHFVQLGPQRDPQQHLVRDAFLAEFDVDYHEIEVEPQEKAQKDSQHAPALDIAIGIARKRFGPRWIGGLRADESGARRIRARMGSPSSCWPICWWSLQDVFGWLAAFKLPVHPAYAMTGGGRWDRKQIRVSIIGGAKGRGIGRAEWEREYYGDVLRRIEAATRAVPVSDAG